VIVGLAALVVAACGAVAEDPHHCGVQGYDCLGGTCSSGMCGPVTLASGIGIGRALTVDGTRVYWVDSGMNVSMVPKAGGPVTLLATLPRAEMAISIATDGTDVYVADGGSTSTAGLYRIPTDGSPPTFFAVPFAPSPNSSVTSASVAVDPRGCVVWSYSGYATPNMPGAIARLCAAATTPEILADTTDRHPSSLAVDATATYWAESVPRILQDFTFPCTESPGAIRMLSGSAAPVTVAHGYPGLGAGLASDGTSLYWRDMCSGTVFRLPHGASSPTALAAVSTTRVDTGRGGYPFPGDVAADALGAYASSDAGVVRVPKDGGPARLVAPGQQGRPMAVDDTRLYFLTGEALVAYAKPPQ
jgi:hypothetical protein